MTGAFLDLHQMQPRLRPRGRTCSCRGAARGPGYVQSHGRPGRQSADEGTWRRQDQEFRAFLLHPALHLRHSNLQSRLFRLVVPAIHAGATGLVVGFENLAHSVRPGQTNAAGTDHAVPHAGHRVRRRWRFIRGEGVRGQSWHSGGGQGDVLLHGRERHDSSNPPPCHLAQDHIIALSAL